MKMDCDVTLIPGRYDQDELFRDMELSGVDFAAITAEPPVYLNQLDSQMKKLSQLVHAHEDCLTGVGYVDPRLNRVKEQIHRYREDYGFRALRMDSGRCGVRLDDFSLMAPVAEAALAVKLPLLATVSAATFDATHPSRLARLLEAYPQLPVVAVHMGGASRPDYCADVFEVAKTHGNLLLLGSAVYWQRVTAAFCAVGPGRLLFGSATPTHCLMPAAVAAFRTMLQAADASEEDVHAVFCGNAQKIFA